jgi:hypothetical protein
MFSEIKETAKRRRRALERVIMRSELTIHFDCARCSEDLSYEFEGYEKGDMNFSIVPHVCTPLVLLALGKKFPIQTQNPPEFISWDVAKVAYQDYVMRFGNSQSIETIAERGGFGVWEMINHLHSMVLRQGEQMKELKKTLGALRKNR